MRLTPADIVRVAGPYFESTGDRRSRVWLFSPDRPALSPRGIRWFGAGERLGGRLTVFEEFGGQTALLLNHDTIVARRDAVIVSRPVIIMDTHVLGLLQSYLVQRPKADPTQEANRLLDREIVYRFIRFAVGTGYDYNPFFSVLETVAKEPDSAQRRNRVRRALATVLAFHTMDEERFVDTGDVVLDRAALERYEDEYRVTGIEAVADARTDRLEAQATAATLAPMERGTCAVLLKAALLQRERGDVGDKLGALRAFVDAHIRLQMGREEILAALMFNGAGTPLPRLEQSRDPAVYCQRVRAAAWDLLFLRMPEFLLTFRGLSAFDETIPSDTAVGSGRTGAEFTVAYLATRDQALASLGRACTIDLVADGKVTYVVPPVALSYDPDELTALVGAEMARVLGIGGDAATRLSTRLGADRAPPPDQEELDALVRELEREIRAL